MKNRSLMWWFSNSKLPKFGEKYRIFADNGNQVECVGYFACKDQIPSRYFCLPVRRMEFTQNEIEITLRSADYGRN